MDTNTIVAIILIIVLFAIATLFSKAKSGQGKNKVEYIYSLKRNGVMTDAEKGFFNRLERIAGDRYYIFPQIHLSSLLNNDTRGRYYKLSYQRINRRSIDYLLCDKQSLQPVYAVELDDSSHDSAKRKARDAVVQKILEDADFPLIRFRNPSNLSDEDIANSFYQAAHKSTD